MVPAHLVSEAKARLDEEYASCFPGQEGWETGALLLLLVHHLAVLQRSQDERLAFDTCKYELMHALRWGRDCQSSPLAAPPNTVDQAALECAVRAWRSAQDYDVVRGAFLQNRQGVVRVKSLSERRIEFTSNPSWRAFDVLDRVLHERREARVETASFADALQPVVDAALENANPEATGPETYVIDPEKARVAIDKLRPLHSPVYRLPDDWVFDGIPIGSLRSVWDALSTMATIHYIVTTRLHADKLCTFANLMVWPKRVWVERLCSLTDLDETTVSRAVGLHTYDRCAQYEDIAITPLLPVGSELLAAGPFVLNSSAFERNFCAHTARHHKKLYDDSVKDKLQLKMTADLTLAFQRAGFCAGGPVKIDTKEGKGDIDLLVWSDKERCVLAAELVWFIDPGDFMEVVNRCESRAACKFADQLPKYRAALETDPRHLVACALGMKKPPSVEHSSSLMIMRGFSGTPRMRGYHVPFVDEQLLLKHLNGMPSLQALSQWCTTMPYLPRPGIDFIVFPIEVRSPSGFEVLTHGAASCTRCTPLGLEL